ncbi:MAG: SDR family NAD(P)-dependent oxidoreductase [Alphaproteobacteria bacterium]|jgi:NAD(P)-dependent dehydrogenase (short-subunit alcohol dehydrogenase family)|nr:SDR family NAD(P)-dependent oxidoreductase [Rickettsiales bacterium]
MNALTGKIALITGASRGIGAALAQRFAAEGAQVILTARTVGGLEAVDDAIRARGGNPATIVPLDLRQGEMIDALAAEIFKRYDRLDILVGNAAMLGSLSPLSHALPAEFEDIFKINVTANYRLLRALDPLLRRSDAGRVIMVTSGAAAAPLAYWGPYAASKAALEHLTLTYAAEIRQTSIRANLIDPGAVRTKMRAQAFPGEDPTSLPTPEAITDLFVELAGAKAPQGRIIRV